MRVIVDMMGGDKAPLEVLGGVMAAAGECDADFLLIGDREKLLQIAGAKHWDISGFDILHTSSVVTMEDNPISVLREKKDSSLRMGLQMLADGKGDAFVSAGNTGALFTGSSLIVKRVQGVGRAAIGTVLPGERGPFLLIDAGANITVNAEYLEQFAVMGSAYMKSMYAISEPAVGLLNNGTEQEKGTPLHVETNHRLCQCKSIHYIGNVEGGEAMFGACHVLVTDGFTGNVFLKTLEGSCKLMMKTLKGVYSQTFLTKLSALLLGKSLLEMKRKFDPSEYGGSPILGISKPVIKAHGSSDAKAFKNAILEAIRYAKSGVNEEIARAAEAFGTYKKTGIV